MSQFTSPLICEVIGNRKYKVYIPFTYHVGYKGSPYMFTVPAGFETDFASVPRAFWSIFPPDGKYTKASVLHDYLYKAGIVSKEYADKVFYEAMRVLDVHPITAKILFYAVHFFGKKHYVEKGYNK